MTSTGTQASPALPTAGLRVLLVEDNATDATATLIMLEALGCEADLANNGQGALQSLQKKDFDVVLMDVQMRDMTGYEATRLIKEQIPLARRPRIVALTARSMPGDREACLANGMDDYLAKPCSPQQLAQVIAAHAMQAIDPAMLKNYAGRMKPEAVGRLIDAYLKDLPKLIAELREATAPAAVANAAHSLKSSSEVVGAKMLALLAKQLEHAGRIGQLDGVPELVRKVEALQGAVDAELRALRGRAGQR
jgi:CheY-like chemotaxis protein